MHMRSTATRVIYKPVEDETSEKTNINENIVPQPKQIVQKAQSPRAFTKENSRINIASSRKPARSHELPMHMRSTATRVIYKPEEDEDETSEKTNNENKVPYEQKTPIGPSTEETEIKNESYETETTSVNDDESEPSSIISLRPGCNPFRSQRAEPEQLKKSSSPRNPFWKELQEIRIQNESLERKISMNKENRQTEAELGARIKESAASKHGSAAVSKPEEPKKIPLQAKVFKNALQSIYDQKYKDNNGSISKETNVKKAYPLTEKLTKIPEPRLMEAQSIKQFEVKIREFSSPSKFWFQYNLKALILLMEDLK
jgi:hypothetical protein